MMLEYEGEYWRKGMRSVAGVDEAGRGPLAGPVVVAAVILRPNFYIEGVTDSKMLSAAERNIFFDQIKKEAEAYHISFIPRQMIDRINILQASLLGMRKCIENLRIIPDQILVDGNGAKIATPKNLQASSNVLFPFNPFQVEAWDADRYIIGWLIEWI